MQRFTVIVAGLAIACAGSKGVQADLAVEADVVAAPDSLTADLGQETGTLEAITVESDKTDLDVTEVMDVLPQDAPADVLDGVADVQAVEEAGEVDLWEALAEVEESALDETHADQPLDVEQPADHLQDAPAPDLGSDVPGMSAKKAELFDETKVLRFDLEFEPADWQKFLSYVATKQKKDVPCKFRYGDEVFEKAACRPKGNEEYWPLKKKPDFIIRFNKYDSAGRFHGLRRIMLEGSTFHAAPVRERLAMWFARESGLDASAANHVQLFINGSNYGPYQNIEALDREFIEDHFPGPVGNLYEEGTKLQTNEEIGDTSDLKALNDIVAKEPLAGDHTFFYIALDAMIDVDQFLREMAVEVLLGATDNFSNGSENFYYYNHPDRGFLVLPWDMDEVFEAPPESDLYAYWGPPEFGNAPNKLRLLMNQNPAWKAKFDAYLAELVSGPHTKLAARADMVCEQIKPLVAADPYKRAPLGDFESDCKGIKDRIAARAAYVKQTLGL